MTPIASKATHAIYAQCLALNGPALAGILLALCLVGIVVPLVAYAKGRVHGYDDGIKTADLAREREDHEHRD